MREAGTVVGAAKRVSGVGGIGKRGGWTYMHAEHQIIKETPGWTIFPLERSTPGHGGGAKGGRGGGGNAGTNVREAAGLRRRFGQGGGRTWAAGKI